MGDPKKLKKQYSTPIHPWNKVSIEEERKLTREYGFKNKKEIFIANSILKKYKDRAKKLISTITEQGQREREQMITKLQQLGLLQAGARADDVLSIQLRDVLERRLQSLVFRKGLARTARQARQFIAHRHIVVQGEEISSPAYIVSTEEEATIVFKERSSLADSTHPERVLIVQEPDKKDEKPTITEAEA